MASDPPTTKDLTETVAATHPEFGSAMPAIDGLVGDCTVNPVAMQKLVSNAIARLDPALTDNEVLVHKDADGHTLTVSVIFRGDSARRIRDAYQTDDQNNLAADHEGEHRADQSV
ncbi:MAG: hypothetical protein ACYCOU_07435 [Sulfobacillus sp.]